MLQNYFAVKRGDTIFLLESSMPWKLREVTSGTLGQNDIQPVCSSVNLVDLILLSEDDDLDES